MKKETEIIEFEDYLDKKDEQDELFYIRSYMFIKGYATGMKLEQTLFALPAARKLHKGQYRKDNTPYICHPLKVCSTLINYGIEDDMILAAALLHDVLEDCEDHLPGGEEDLKKNYYISQEVIDIVKLLTKRSGMSDEELKVYFKEIRKSPEASLVKLSDRLHNISTVYNLTPEKMKKYLRETKIFLLPLASWCKEYRPQYRNAFNILKNSIESLNHTVEIMLEKTAK